MAYFVKEIYYTLQGEGAHAGRSAVFCRFSRCNLWSGRESQRPAATCRFCDTDFVGTNGPGGGRFADARSLAAAVASAWAGEPAKSQKPYVVCTGGEPLLQLDSEAVDSLHAEGFEVAVETNGTLPAPSGLDWVCVSPKAGTDLAIDSGDELKLVYPQPDAMPEEFENLAFDRFYLQPMDGPLREQNTADAVAYCLAHPLWRLSIQTHKYLGIA